MVIILLYYLYSGYPRLKLNLKTKKKYWQFESII